MPFLYRHFARVFAFAVVKPEWLNQHVHTRVVRVDIAYNVVRDIEYGQNSMSEIKTLAQKMDIGRYGKLGNGIPKFSRACGGGRAKSVKKSGFHHRGGFRYTYSERHPHAYDRDAAPAARRYELAYK